jgi:hypothetical protein
MGATRIGFEFAQAFMQGVEDLDRQGVAGVGAVDGQAGDWAVEVEEGGGSGGGG